MRLAWPILPLAHILAACGLIIGGLFLLTLPIDVEHLIDVRREDAPAEDISDPGEAIPDAGPPVSVPDNPAQLSQQAAARILARSPFIKERTPFSRTPPAPPPPEPVPEFVGFLGKGEARRAMIIWQPGQQALTHKVGEETPWGRLVSFDENSLKFEGETGARQLELY